MTRIAAIILLILAIVPRLALADGMPIDKTGRFYGGTTTVITLTKAQIKTLSLPENKWHRLALTDEQRAKLKKESGKNPVMFMFYDTRIGETDCTCEAANRALRFSETEAEIPHDYLQTDEDAAEIDKNH
jgi:hypothetical protein